MKGLGTGGKGLGGGNHSATRQFPFDHRRNATCGLAALVVIRPARPRRSCATLSADATRGSSSFRSPSAFQNIGDPAQRSRAHLRRDRKGADPSALHELPSCRRPAAAGRRSPSSISRRPGARTCLRRQLARPATPIANFTLHDARVISRASPAIRAGSSRRCRWPGKASRSARFAGRSRTRTRNGGRDLALLQEHIAKDDLVAWGWNPGAGREPAPGSQELAGQTGRRPGSTAARNARELLTLTGLGVLHLQRRHLAGQNEIAVVEQQRARHAVLVELEGDGIDRRLLAGLLRHARDRNS